MSSRSGIMRFSFGRSEAAQKSIEQESDRGCSRVRVTQCHCAPVTRTPVSRGQITGGLRTCLSSFGRRTQSGQNVLAAFGGCRQFRYGGNERIEQCFIARLGGRKFPDGGQASLAGLSKTRAI